MSDLGSDDLEAYAERTGIPLTAPTAGTATPPPEVIVVGEAITLDLGSGAAAWDDSELVNAWDAAAEEFRLHNPGPGTWLDKATAALAVGKPLPGAKHGESKWYTETPPAKPTFVNPYAQPDAAKPARNSSYTEPPAHRKKSTIRTNLKKKRKAEEMSRAAASQGTGNLPLEEGGSLDMELDDETQSPIAPYPNAPQSPAYTPNSPTMYATAPSTAGPALPDHLSRHRQPQNPYLSSTLPPSPLPTSHIAAPPPGSTTYEPTRTGMYPEMGATSGGQPLTKEEATTRAVNAQWWAGYWFAMSEVMPSVAQLEQTEAQFQR